MKTVLVLLFLMTTACDSSTTVYVCDSKGAVRYHYRSDCRGLRNCSYKIVKTTLEKAKKSGKTLCHWEKN